MAEAPRAAGANGRQGRGIVFVVSSPSGAGKTTIVRRLLETLPGLGLSVSHTTRPPRAGEADGRDYHFTTLESFRRMVDEDRFLEWAQVHGNLYGTSRQAVAAVQGAGRDVLLDIDVQGARQVRERMPGCVLVFVQAPSEEELRRRLTGRGTETSRQIEARLEAGRRELAFMPFYDYCVVNDDLAEAVEAFRCIVVAERCRIRGAEGGARREETSE